VRLRRKLEILLLEATIAVWGAGRSKDKDGRGLQLEKQKTVTISELICFYSSDT
jgi:hypothetical protein